MLISNSVSSRTPAPVEEEQIHSIPGVSDTQAPLSPNKSEVTAEFKKKSFKLYYERGLKIGLGVLVLQREEGSQKLPSLESACLAAHVPRQPADESLDTLMYDAPQLALVAGINS